VIFYLEDDHLDGMDRGVVNFDVVLLEVEVSRSNVFTGESFERLAGDHVGFRDRTHDDVVLADVGQTVHLDKFHSRNTLGLDKISESVVISGEDRDRARLRERLFTSRGGDGRTHHGVRRGFADHAKGIVFERASTFFTT
jgi:hypothetical protein